MRYYKLKSKHSDEIFCISRVFKGGFTQLFSDGEQNTYNYSFKDHANELKRLFNPAIEINVKEYSQIFNKFLKQQYNGKK